MLFKHILVFSMKTSLYSYLSSVGAIFHMCSEIKGNWK